MFYFVVVVVVVVVVAVKPTVKHVRTYVANNSVYLIKVHFCSQLTKWISRSDTEQIFTRIATIIYTYGYNDWQVKYVCINTLLFEVH